MAGIGPPELMLMFLVVLLLFGAAKLPELARGTGRALRIFKAEVQSLDGAEMANEEGDDQRTGDRSSNGPGPDEDEGGDLREPRE